LSGYPRPVRGEYTNSAKNRRNELYLICCRGLRDLLGDSGRARYSFSRDAPRGAGERVAIRHR
jgi:hypothetical protein